MTFTEPYTSFFCLAVDVLTLSSALPHKLSYPATFLSCYHLPAARCRSVLYKHLMLRQLQQHANATAMRCWHLQQLMKLGLSIRPPR